MFTSRRSWKLLRMGAGILPSCFPFKEALEGYRRLQTSTYNVKEKKAADYLLPNLSQIGWGMYIWI